MSTMPTPPADSGYIPLFGVDDPQIPLWIHPDDAFPTLLRDVRYLMDLEKAEARGWLRGFLAGAIVATFGALIGLWIGS